MANSLSARKRARQNETSRQRNAGQRSHVRSAIKNVVNAIAKGDKEVASSAYKLAVPAIDRAVAHGIMPMNKAARHKSRLNAHIKGL